ncbi:MAG TPA: helix-turn-helix domain-containing protein [Candidatus Butyricicoccus stercorigallinarum]|nr:helix-turn-helix domain-containing protein [Candidatus Butyricicoccus stercorigallinarum]
MILADKIIRLRKRNGWSQEELAAKMNVSRQAVSKWEAAQTTPDLEKILQLGRLFGVTTDYLLKDEMEEEAFTEETDLPVKRMTLSQADHFLKWRRSASIQIAIATFLCVIAVIPLLLLGAASGVSALSLSENVAGGIGLVSLFVFVAVAVLIFLHCGFQNAPYAFLDKEPFETEYGVTGMVRERQKEYRPVYVRSNLIATGICVLSPVPLLAGAFTENEFVIVILLTITLLLAGVGAGIFIVAGVRWASMQKLLKEGEYTPSEIRKSRVREAVSTAYWLSAAAIYLGWSFFTNAWETTWIVWPVAGVLFAGVMAVCRLFSDRQA